MKLNIKERIVVLSILPKEGDFKTLKQIREMRESLSFADHENESLKFIASKEGNIQWTEPVDGESYVKEIEIPESIMLIIKMALTELNANKKLNADTFEIYEKFMEEEE